MNYIPPAPKVTAAMFRPKTDDVGIFADDAVTIVNKFIVNEWAQLFDGADIVVSHDEYTGAKFSVVKLRPRPIQDGVTRYDLVRALDPPEFWQDTRDLIQRILDEGLAK